MEINASFFPVASRGALGDSSHGGNFGKSKTAEKAQVNDLGEHRVRLSKLVKSVADACELAIVNSVFEIGRSGSNFKLTAALLRLAIADVVNNQAAHDSRCVSHESGAIRKGRTFARCDFNISLMQKGCRAKAQRNTLTGQFACSEATQLGVQSGKESVRGGRISALDGVYERQKARRVLQRNILLTAKNAETALKECPILRPTEEPALNLPATYFRKSRLSSVPGDIFC
jgi:hypothetical protein